MENWDIGTYLQSEQTKHVLYQAKYGRFGADPFNALQRDSDQVEIDNFDQAEVCALWEAMDSILRRLLLL